MIRKLPWAEMVVTAVVVAMGAGIFLYAHRAEGRLEESKRRGAGVVQALYEYRAEQGTFPEQLEQLVPQYLRAVDPPTWGLQQWRYRTYTAGSDSAGSDAAVLFQLSAPADESGYPVLYYDLEVKRWVLNN